jgi:hypothetical protein
MNTPKKIADKNRDRLSHLCDGRKDFHCNKGFSPIYHKEDSCQHFSPPDLFRYLSKGFKMKRLIYIHFRCYSYILMTLPELRGLPF